MQSDEENEYEQQSSWRHALAMAIRMRFRNQLKATIIEIVEKMTSRQVQEIIDEHESIMNKQARFTPKASSLPTTMLVDDKLMPIKPKDRLLASRLMQ